MPSSNYCNEASFFSFAADGFHRLMLFTAELAECVSANKTLIFAACLGVRYIGAEALETLFCFVARTKGVENRMVAILVEKA